MIFNKYCEKNIKNDKNHHCNECPNLNSFVTKIAIHSFSLRKEINKLFKENKTIKKKVILQKKVFLILITILCLMCLINLILRS